MQLIFLGAEIPSNRTKLVDLGVSDVAVSFVGLKKRVSKPLDQLLDKFPASVRIHAIPGTADWIRLSERQVVDLADEYFEFVTANVDRLSSWLEFDCQPMGADWINKQRKRWDSFDDFYFRPVWHHGQGISELARLSERYPHVAIPLKSARKTPALAGLMRQHHNTWQTDFHLLSTTHPEQVRSLPISSSYTAAWQSPMRNGETIVWDGRKLHRYRAQDKQDARAKHRVHIAASGLDVDKIINDDSSEATRLAIWSLLQMEHSDRVSPPVLATEDSSELHVVGNDDESDLPDNVSYLPEIPSNSGLPTSNHPAGRRRSDNRVEQQVMPMFGFNTRKAMVEGADGKTEVSDIPVLTQTGETVRSCNTCFVAVTCPAFEPDTKCAFSLPIEIKTPDQVKAVLHTVLEMQTSRVSFARYAEELNGGYPDPTVSKEMDRLFSMVKNLKELEENNEFVRVSVERKSAGGVLSALFGERAAAPLAINPDEQT